MYTVLRVTDDLPLKDFNVGIAAAITFRSGAASAAAAETRPYTWSSR